MSEIGKLVFDHTVAKLEAQRGDLSNLRNQAAMSLAMTGLVGTFFATIFVGIGGASGGVADFTSRLAIPLLLVVILFALSLGYAMSVVVWLEDVTFSFDGPTMFEIYDELNDTDAFYRKYAEDGESYFGENEVKISKAQHRLWMAMVLGWGQIIPWSTIIRSMLFV
ncbi:hypothetical protein DI396_01830 [Litorivita pollutaquae]|uniref:Uncharacterized protein n=1 Tax=Litorivita pollutaquae TaxID=2200892 RepID=A0A2V4N248_9RHOB|nr:hypothetical protein [Litorivita pollutaquae]PYC48854.1 hypothetical protein DI396_01830 [Litorivita pollutaquae]